MAKLPEGMTQKRGNYSTEYFYKGAVIHKYRDSYSFRREVLIWQTGRMSVDYSYGSYRLAGAPADVDRFLAENEGKYILDSFGIFRMTEAYKAQLIEGIRARYTQEMETRKAYISALIAQGEWRKVSNCAEEMAKHVKQHEWLDEQVEAVA